MAQKTEIWYVNLQIIRAKHGEIGLIQQLAHKIWWAHYPEIIGERQVEYMLERFYSFDALEKQMAEGQVFFFIKTEMMDSGFIAVTAMDKGKYFINKFYVDLDQHNKGVGTATFSALLNELSDVQEIQLQVNRMNYKPINFYFKLGFVIDRVADFDIGDGYFMNDFVMKWKSITNKG